MSSYFGSPVAIESLETVAHKIERYKREGSERLNRVLKFMDDYAVEIQTVAVIVAGVVLTNRVVKSQKAIKKELGFVHNSVSAIREEQIFQNDERWIGIEEKWRQKEELKMMISNAKINGTPFEYYPGLGVLFPPKES